MPTVPALLIES
jgi:hypothetical protein